jgi:predicted NBD/HSP70 family sugar kinase
LSALEDVRERSMRAFVDALRLHGALSRSELARVTGLSRTTIVSLVDELDARGLIVDHDGGAAADRRSPGRPTRVVRLHPSAGAALGISVEREELRVALVDLSLKVLSYRSSEFELDTPAATLLELALELADAALADPTTGRGDLIGVVLGLPSPIDPRTGDTNPWILGNWDAPAARDRLSAHFGVPVTTDNDANLEALAEVALGAGRGLETVVYVKVSWGIGGAILVNGVPQRGRDGYAGEFGHIKVRDEGPRCRCGRVGCLGQLASGHVLREALEPVHGSPVTLHDINRLAAAGDVGVLRLLADAGREIGAGLAGVCLAVNPDSLIVGGELGGVDSALLAGVREGLRARGMPAVAEATAVRGAEMGRNANALGGASLVVRSAAALEHLVGRL